MDFRKLMFGESSDQAKMRTEFNVKIERQTPTAVVQFDGKVSGHFIGKGGKPDFVAERIIVDGMPEMKLRKFFPEELKEVKKYALSVELPRMLGTKLR